MQEILAGFGFHCSLKSVANIAEAVFSKPIETIARIDIAFGANRDIVILAVVFEARPISMSKKGLD